MKKEKKTAWNKGLKGVQSSTKKGKSFEEFYGIERALEIKNKASKSHSGRKQSKEEIEKRASALRGRKRKEIVLLWQNPEWRANQIAKRKGKTPWNKGKKTNKQSEETKLKRSISLKKAYAEGRHKKNRKGLKHSITKEQRNELSLKFKGKNLEELYSLEKAKKMRKNLIKSHIEYFKKHPEARINLREKRLSQKMPTKNTSIELKIKKQLEDAGIIHESQKSLESITIPDFFIPSDSKLHKGVVVYADGDYWHSLSKTQERDAKITKDLFNKGYYVVRLKQNYINEPDFDVIKTLEEVIPLQYKEGRRRHARA